MKQLPFLIHDKDDLVEALAGAELAAKAMTNPSILVSVLLDCENEELFARINSAILEKFPSAQIFGSVSTGEIINGKILEEGIIVSFSLFETSKVEVLGFDFSSEEGAAIGGRLTAYIKANPDVRAVKMIAAGLHINLKPLFKKLSEVDKDIVFFGGLADEGSLGKNSLVFAKGKIIRNGVAIVIFSGRELFVTTCSSFGWRPLGRKMKITRTDGEFCVLEVDDKPIVDVFEQYLGIENTDEIMKETSTFPFYIERSGMVVARQPLICRSDGGVVFNADMRVGEEVRFSYGDPSIIIENASTMQDSLAEFRPEAIYVVSCLARWLLLAQDIKAEIAVMRALAPSSGFYAYGEFMRTAAGELMINNMMLVTVGMREGEAKDNKPIKLVHPQLQKSRSAILAHLVKLVQSTTKELESSHKELAHLVRIDRLTGILLNRGATEHRLEELLENARLYNKPLSVMMMDVDDFKHINDSYGHTMGDRALREIAKILRDNTRAATDAPGRWGGDEFFVVFGNTTVEVATKIANRIIKLVRELKCLPDGKRITTSIGVVAAKHDDTPDSLYSRADRALYAAKLANGKNNVTVQH